MLTMLISTVHTAFPAVPPTWNTLIFPPCLFQLFRDHLHEANTDFCLSHLSVVHSNTHINSAFYYLFLPTILQLSNAYAINSEDWGHVLYLLYFTRHLAQNQAYSRYQKYVCNEKTTSSLRKNLFCFVI